MIRNALRFIEILRFVPRRAPGITAAELACKLENAGTRIHLRSVQRDLQSLSISFPLVAEGKPLRWRWMESVAGMQLPAMDLSGATIWVSIAMHMRTLLPPDLLEEIEPQFATAFDILRKEHRGRGVWPKRITRIPSGLALKPPRIDPDVYRVVAESLAARHCFHAEYRARGEKAKAMTVHPLGLVLRDHLTYLVAVLGDYDLPIHLALHRFVRAEATEAAARELRAFDLHVYASGTAFGYPAGGPIRLRLRFTAEAGFHLTEASLADDQRIRQLSDGTYEVAATVENTYQLRWWLRAFGDQVEVLKPAMLRQEMASHALGLAGIYAKK